MTDITKVGIGVAVFKGDHVLLGVRKGSHGEGELAFPGGHMEYMESFHAVALRELAEEVGEGFVVKGLEVVSIINLTDYAPKHYIDIGLACEWVSGDPIVMEPDKCEAWVWVPISKIMSGKTALFKTVSRIVEAAVSSSGVKVYDKE